MTTGPDTSISRETHGIEIIRVKGAAFPRSFAANLLISFRLFFKALSLQKHDIIITKSDPPLFVFFGYFIALFKRAKHVHWCQDLYPDILPALKYKTSATAYKIFDRLTTFAMKRCTRIVTIGNCMRHNVLKKGIIPSKVKIIPNWYDSILEKDANVPKANTLPTKFRILYAGNMGRAHPYQTILDAAEHLSANDPDIEFLFVGNAIGLNDLSKERARRGLENIRFLPYQPSQKLKALLESGDVHLVSMSDKALGCMVPSRIYDIFSVQRPCIFIGPETSDLSLMLDTYEAGLTIAQGQGETLANAIRHLRDHGEDWHALYTGAGRAAHMFTPEFSYNKWRKLLESI